MLSLMITMFVLTGCSSTQQAFCGVVTAVGAATTVIAVGDSMDGHPRNQPNVVSRRGDPHTDIPIAMTAAAVFIVGGIIFLAGGKHHSSHAH